MGRTPRSRVKGASKLSPSKTPRQSLSVSPQPESVANLALRACEKCTRSKRKCDKKVPACGRCTRLNARCSYDYQPAPPNASIMHPDVLAEYFSRGGLITPLLDTIGSDSNIEATQIASLLANRNIDWHAAVASYFDTVHRWFTIINMDKFYASTFQGLRAVAADADPGRFLVPSWTQPRTGSPSSEGSGNGDEQPLLSGEAALLIACVFLTTQVPDRDDKNQHILGTIYRTIKRVFVLLKCLRSPTLELMQSGALISLYEWSHGDSMSAYRTLSETVTMTQISGITAGNQHAVSSSYLDAEEEERRALWWGLFTLDQYIHLDSGTQHLPMLLDEPHQNDLLPSGAHASTEMGYPPLQLQYLLSTPVSVPLGNFQRIAQTAVFLHRALQHRRTHNLSPNASSELDRSIREMLDALLQQHFSHAAFCHCVTMCLSSLFIVYRPILLNPSAIDPNPATVEYSTRKALVATKFAINFVHSLCIHLPSNDGAPGEDVHRPRVVAATSCIMSFYALETLALFEGKFAFERAGQVFRDIRASMRLSDERWHVAGKFLRGLSSINSSLTRAANTPKLEVSDCIDPKIRSLPMNT